MDSSLAAAIRAAMQEVVAHNPAQVAIRRGGASLPAQTVRIAPANNAMPHPIDGGGLQAVKRGVVISGAVGLDIQPQDRFTYQGQLYEVDQVLPDRRFVTLAYGKLVQ